MKRVNVLIIKCKYVVENELIVLCVFFSMSSPTYTDVFHCEDCTSQPSPDSKHPFTIDDGLNDSLDGYVLGYLLFFFINLAN